MNKEIAHYVVTAHPPGGVLMTCQCNFLSDKTMDTSEVLVAKSRRIEVRQLRTNTAAAAADKSAAALAVPSSPFPIMLQIPIHARITSLHALKLPNCSKDLVFLTTDRFQYAVISHNPFVMTSHHNNRRSQQQHYHHQQQQSQRGRSSKQTASGPTLSLSSLSPTYTCNPYPIYTHCSGNFKTGMVSSQNGYYFGDDAGGGATATATSGSGNGSSLTLLGRPAPSGPLIAVDPYFRCIALHFTEGLLTILPINTNYTYHGGTTTGGGGAGNLKSGDDDNDESENPAGTADVMMSGAPQGAAPGSGSSAQRQQLLGAAFHCRMEESCILAITFLHNVASGASSTGNRRGGAGGGANDAMPQLCVLHQDARGSQHLITHVVNLKNQKLHLYGSASAPPNTEWMKKSSVDGGSSLLISVPPVILTSGNAAIQPAAAAAAAATSSATVVTASVSSANKSTTAIVGGVILLGQRQLTYLNSHVSKVVPVPQALFLSYDVLPPDPANQMPRFLLGDEFGNLHMLTLVVIHEKVVALQFDTLGSCTLSTCLNYLGDGLVFVGSQLGDSQLIQVHDEPITEHEDEAAAAAAAGDGVGVSDVGDEEMDLAETTYLTVVEEYTHLGPILDFDLVPTTPGVSAAATAAAAAATEGAAAAPAAAAVGQCQVVTASGSSKSGSLRLIRNGIGMNEYASVEIPGIQNMWSVRASFYSKDDSFLVQSFVTETRVLGISSSTTMMMSSSHQSGMGIKQEDFNEDHEGSSEESDEDGAAGTLEEVELPGLDSKTATLYVGNVKECDAILQITQSEIRLFSTNTTPAMVSTMAGQILDTCCPGSITVVAANEAGQIAVAMSGGIVAYFCVQGDKIKKIHERQMDREVGCIDIHPFYDPTAVNLFDKSASNAMDVDNDHENLSKRSGTDEIAHSDAHKSNYIAVGLWDDCTVRLLSLENNQMEEVLCIGLGTDDDEIEEVSGATSQRRNRNNMMARSLCLITLDFSSSSSSNAGSNTNGAGGSPGVDMLFAGLGDGTLISFAVGSLDGKIAVRSKKEVCLGTQRIDLVPLSTERGGTCVLATGDRPTVIYLAGVGGTFTNQFNPKLCYSNVNLSASENEEGDGVSRPPSQQAIAVNVAAPFYSPLLFDVGTLGNQHYTLCVADDANLRLGVIDDIQKLHVTTCRLGMAPRRIVHCSDGRLFAVGCIESGIKHFGLGGDETNMGNCIRFMDDTTFDDIERIDLEPYEMILSMAYVTMKVQNTDESGGGSSGGDSSTSTSYKPFLLVGTAYALPDEDEPTRGRILVYSFQAAEESATTTNNSRAVRQVTELSVQGGVYSICQFYEGRILCTVNSKTHLCHLVDEAGLRRLQFKGVGHHGHILSLFVKSRARSMDVDSMGRASASSSSSGQGTGGMKKSNQMSIDIVQSESSKKKDARSGSVDAPAEMLAIVADLMRSIGLIQYYPQHDALEEIARDFNSNWTTAVEMLNDHVYLGAENWNNLFCLRRNTASQSEEIRCRLDTIGEFHLGEMCNKFMCGSLIMPLSQSSSSSNISSTNNSASANNASSKSRRRSPQKKKSAQMSSSSASSPNKIGSSSMSSRRPVVVTGSHTLFGTVDGTLGVILGLDGRTAAFFGTLERAMSLVIRPVGDLHHSLYRAVEAEHRVHPAHGFVDGDLVESFLDLDRYTMEAVVSEMNRDGGWEVDDSILRATVSSAGGASSGVTSTKPGSGGAATAATNVGAGGTSSGREPVVVGSNDDGIDEDRLELTVDDVLAMVEEMTMMH